MNGTWQIFSAHMGGEGPNNSFGTPPNQDQISYAAADASSPRSRGSDTQTPPHTARSPQSSYPSSSPVAALAHFRGDVEQLTAKVAALECEKDELVKVNTKATEQLAHTQLLLRHYQVQSKYFTTFLTRLDTDLGHLCEEHFDVLNAPSNSNAGYEDSKNHDPGAHNRGVVASLAAKLRHLRERDLGSPISGGITGPKEEHEHRQTKVRFGPRRPSKQPAAATSPTNNQHPRQNNKFERRLSAWPSSVRGRRESVATSLVQSTHDDAMSDRRASKFVDAVTAALAKDTDELLERISSFRDPHPPIPLVKMTAAVDPYGVEPAESLAGGTVTGVSAWPGGTAAEADAAAKSATAVDLSDLIVSDSDTSASGTDYDDDDDDDSCDGADGGSYSDDPDHDDTTAASRRPSSSAEGSNNKNKSKKGMRKKEKKKKEEEEAPAMLPSALAMRRLLLEGVQQVEASARDAITALIETAMHVGKRWDKAVARRSSEAKVLKRYNKMAKVILWKLVVELTQCRAELRKQEEQYAECRNELRKTHQHLTRVVFHRLMEGGKAKEASSGSARQKLHCPITETTSGGTPGKDAAAGPTPQISSAEPSTNGASSFAVGHAHRRGLGGAARGVVGDVVAGGGGGVLVDLPKAPTHAGKPGFPSHGSKARQRRKARGQPSSSGDNKRNERKDHISAADGCASPMEMCDPVAGGEAICSLPPVPPSGARGAANAITARPTLVDEEKKETILVQQQQQQPTEVKRPLPNTRAMTDHAGTWADGGVENRSALVRIVLSTFVTDVRGMLKAYGKTNAGLWKLWSELQEYVVESVKLSGPLNGGVPAHRRSGTDKKSIGTSVFKQVPTLSLDDIDSSDFMDSFAQPEFLSSPLVEHLLALDARPSSSGSATSARTTLKHPLQEEVAMLTELWEALRAYLQLNIMQSRQRVADWYRTKLVPLKLSELR